MDTAIDAYRKRRAERLSSRGVKVKIMPNTENPQRITAYQRGKMRFKGDNGYKNGVDTPLRNDADGDEENNNQGGGDSGGGHGNTRLPYGLCLRFGIAIEPGWTPKDAWDALAGKGITPGGAYERLKKGEDPGTPDVPEAPKPEPVRKAALSERGGAEYEGFTGTKYTWASRGTDPWALTAKLVEGSAAPGSWAPSWFNKRFRTKYDMLYWLRDKGIEEFADPETGELVNPKEMDLPEKIGTIDGMGIAALSIGLRDGRYTVIATDLDGKKKTLNDFSSLAKAKEFAGRTGVTEDKMKLSPSLKKREVERLSWLTSGKKEYLEHDGKRYGDLELKAGDYGGYKIFGENEAGEKMTWGFPTKTEAMMFLKDSGVEKLREGKETRFPAEFEAPPVAAEIKGKKWQEIGLHVDRWDRVLLYGIDMDGNRDVIDYARGTVGQFKEKLANEYGVTDSKLKISDEDRIGIERLEQAEVERERRRKEFESKSIPFGAYRYMDPFIEKDSDGDYYVSGFDETGDKRRISSWGDMHDIASYCDKFGYDPKQFIKSDEIMEDYERYLEAKKTFETSAVSLPGGRFTKPFVIYDGHMYKLRGYDERGRMKELTRAVDLEDLEDRLEPFGFNAESFPLDDAAKKRVEQAKRARELIATGEYYSMGGHDVAYKDLRVEKDPDAVGSWKIVGTDMDGDEVTVAATDSWDDAIDKMAYHGVKSYKVIDGGKELGMPKDGMHSVMLMRKPGGGFSVYAATSSKPRGVVYETENESDARNWLKENNVPTSGIKTRGMNPNDDAPRTHTQKTLENFDTYRMKQIENTFVDDMTEAEKKDAVDMLTEMFDKGAIRAFRSGNSVYGILTEGYKSQPEIGHGGAAAAYDPEGRKRASQKFFGHSGVKSNEYEKCGYLGFPDDKEDWDDGSADGYGGSTPVMYTFKKDRMNDRMTYTFGDSLNTRSRISSAGYGGPKPTIEGMTALYSKRDVDRAVQAYKEYKDGKITYSEFFRRAKDEGNNNYVELQFHGPVTAEDIEKMTFKSQLGIDRTFDKMSAEKRKKAFDVLKKNGIQIMYKDGGRFIDAWEHLRNRYGADI